MGRLTHLIRNDNRVYPLLFEDSISKPRQPSLSSYQTPISTGRQAYRVFRGHTRGYISLSMTMKSPHPPTHWLLFPLELISSLSFLSCPSLAFAKYTFNLSRCSLLLFYPFSLSSSPRLRRSRSARCPRVSPSSLSATSSRSISHARTITRSHPDCCADFSSAR